MNIVKIGGSKDIDLQAVIKDIALMNEKTIIVHGANEFRDSLLQELGIDKQILTSISGKSSVFTDEQMLDTMMMTYSGLLNKKIVEICQQEGINAIGLTGLDGQLIRGRKNRGIKIYQNGKKKIIRDRSGKPKTINVELLELLLENGYTPVLTMPILDEMNRAINSENDDVVALLSTHFNCNAVYFVISENGLLRDFNDKSSTINLLNRLEFMQYKDSVDGRIQRKMIAIEKIMQNNTEIFICNGKYPLPLFNPDTEIIFNEIELTT